MLEVAHIIRGRKGAVERIHITLRKELICKYLENIDNFDLENALIKTINNYNRIRHRVTKYSPIEVFFSTDESLFDKVYNNTLEYYNNFQKNNILYEKEEKCLMQNNKIKTNKKYNNKYLII